MTHLSYLCASLTGIEFKANGPDDISKYSISSVYMFDGTLKKVNEFTNLAHWQSKLLRLHYRTSNKNTILSFFDVNLI